MIFDSYEPWFRELSAEEEAQVRAWANTLTDEQLAQAVRVKDEETDQRARAAAARFHTPRRGIVRP